MATPVCRRVTQNLLMGFYVVLSIVLGLVWSLVSGRTGLLVGLGLGVAGSVGMYFTVGKKMICQPIPLIGNPTQCALDDAQLAIINAQRAFAKLPQLSNC